MLSFFSQVYKAHFCMKQERVNSKIFTPKGPWNADVSEVLVFYAEINKIWECLKRARGDGPKPNCWVIVRVTTCILVCLDTLSMWGECTCVWVAPLG
jgi:hypothetical protein